jgi:ElaB/YqjD/DUF883 family membrane-anchored ribosome-binding protein
MSEVEKHYGGDVDDLDRTKAAARTKTSGAKSERSRHDEGDGGLLDRAEETLESAREGAARAADRVRETVSEQYESLSRNAVYARRRSVAEFNRGRRGVAAFVDENPIMVGVAGLAAGLLIGALLPRTRREDELLGPYADDLRRESLRYAKDAAEQGREALKENIRAMAQPLDRDPGA